MKEPKQKAFITYNLIKEIIKIYRVIQIKRKKTEKVVNFVFSFHHFQKKINKKREWKIWESPAAATVACWLRLLALPNRDSQKPYLLFLIRCLDFLGGKRFFYFLVILYDIGKMIIFFFFSYLPKILTYLKIYKKKIYTNTWDLYFLKIRWQFYT